MGKNRETYDWLTVVVVGAAFGGSIARRPVVGALVGAIVMVLLRLASLFLDLWLQKRRAALKGEISEQEKD